MATAWHLVEVAERIDRAAACFAYEDGAWLVSGLVVNQDGRLVISELTISLNLVDDPEGVPGSGITASELRRLKPTRIVDEVRREMVEAPTWADAARRLTPSIARPEDSDAARRIAAAAGLSDADAECMDLAEAYLREQAAGPGVYQRLASRYPNEYGSPRPIQTLRSQIARIARDGWLTEGSPGRRDRAPGWRLLAEQQKRSTS